MDGSMREYEFDINPCGTFQLSRHHANIVFLTTGTQRQPLFSSNVKYDPQIHGNTTHNAFQNTPKQTLKQVVAR